MKKVLLTTFLFTCFTTLAQVKEAQKNEPQAGDIIFDSYEGEMHDEEEPINYSVLHVQPEFPGGIEAFYKQVNDSIDIKSLQPGAAMQNQLRAVVSFIVEKDGSLSNIKLVKDPGFGFGKQVVNNITAIKTKWTPGKQYNKVVRANLLLPIIYTVPKPEEEQETSLHLLEAPDYETTNLGIEEPVDYKTVQVKPEFPGGLQNFYNYVTRHIEFKNIDDSAKGQKLAATISFIVEKDGSMSNFSTVEDPGFGLGKEVIRVLQNMKTKWNPGIQNGKPVRSTFTFPVVISVPK